MLVMLVILAAKWLQFIVVVNILSIVVAYVSEILIANVANIMCKDVYLVHVALT